MVTVEQANEYLNVVGRLLPADADHRTWLLVIANAVARGLVPAVDWDSSQGAVLIGLIGEVYNDFTEWLDTEGIDPADFKG